MSIHVKSSQFFPKNVHPHNGYVDSEKTTVSPWDIESTFPKKNQGKSLFFDYLRPFSKNMSFSHSISSQRLPKKIGKKLSSLEG